MDPLITKQIQGVLENNIFNKIIALNLNIPNPILRAVISRVAEVGAVDIVKQVTQASNKQLTDIPKNIIGPINPVDITNSNNSPWDFCVHEFRTSYKRTENGAHHWHK